MGREHFPSLNATRSADGTRRQQTFCRRLRGCSDAQVILGDSVETTLLSGDIFAFIPALRKSVHVCVFASRARARACERTPCTFTLAVSHFPERSMSTNTFPLQTGRSHIRGESQYNSVDNPFL